MFAEKSQELQFDHKNCTKGSTPPKEKLQLV